MRARLRVLRLTVVIAIVAGVAAAAPSPSFAGPVTVGVHCYTNPEKVIIHNGRSTRIRIGAIGSTYHPYDFEPIQVGRYLAAGATIVFQSGSKAKSHVLTKNFIFNNSGELDGVRVRTSLGIFTKRC